MQRVFSKGQHFLYGNDGYCCTKANEVHSIIQAKGVACLLGALTPDECTEMNSGMWDTLEYLTSNLKTPIERNDPYTYSSIFHLYPNHGGLIQYHRIGHADYVWKLRGNPKLSEAYTHIYNCNNKDLLVSFDGVNCSLGPVMNGKKRGMYQGNSWLHLDQQLSDSSERCIQSWVTANDIGVGDDTLVFLRGSHLLHDKFAKHFGLKHEKKDWFRLTPEHELWYEQHGCKRICITAPAGSQVFWDSRTVHSGQEPLYDEDFPKRSLPRTHRNVVYLCYQPREKKTLKKRRRIFDESDTWFLRMTTHWPNKMNFFGKYPRTFGNDAPPQGCFQRDNTKYWSFVPDLPKPTLNKLALRLAGITDDKKKDGQFSKSNIGFYLK